MRGLLLIAGVLATSRPAWAKYDPCGRGSVLEPAGRVPRNAKIWLWHGGGDGGERLRIRGPDLDRAIAPPFAGSSRGLAAFDPGLLGRDATYQIAIVFDRHAWTLAELATGSEVDHQPPRPPRFHALAITQLLDPREPAEPAEPARFDDVAGFPGFPLPASDIATALELSDDTVALDVSFDDSAEHFLMPPEAPGLLGRDRCGPKRRFRVGARVCMSIRAIDLAGNRSDAATRCTTVDGRIGDTSRAVHAHAWPARRHRLSGEPYDWLALTALALWLGGLRIAVRRLVEVDSALSRITL
jgi:hypothetical protein